jgi:hypothetical protein
MKTIQSFVVLSLAASLLGLASCGGTPQLSNPYEEDEKTALFGFSIKIKSYFSTIHTYDIPTTRMDNCYGRKYTSDETTVLDFSLFFSAKTTQFIGYDRYYYAYIKALDGQFTTLFYGLDEDGVPYGDKDARDFYMSSRGYANIAIPSSLSVTYFESFFPNNEPTTDSSAPSSRTSSSSSSSRTTSSSDQTTSYSYQETSVNADALLDYSLLSSSNTYAISAKSGVSLPSSIRLPSTHGGLAVSAIADQGFSGHGELQDVEIPSSIALEDNQPFWGCSNAHLFYEGYAEGENRWNQFDTYSDNDARFLPIAYGVVGRGYSNGIRYAITSQDGVTSSQVIGVSGNPSTLNVPATLGGYPVKGIAEAGLARYSSLKHVSLPSALSFLGRSAFCEDSGLQDVNVPSALTSISVNCFQYCSALASFDIPEGITSIGGGAFSHTSALKSATLPKTLQAIPGYLFYQASSLSSLTYRGSMSEWKALPKDSYSCFGGTALTGVTCNDGTVSING